MRRFPRGLRVLAVAMLLAACDKADNGPGALPPPEGSGSPPPGQGDCINGVGHCGELPPPPPPAPSLAITFPDFPGQTEFQALPGNAFTLLAVTTAADAATLSCKPASIVSLTPSGPAGNYLLYLNAMPDQDVPCTITATGPKGEVKTAIVIHPAKPDTVIPLEVRNLPTQFAIGAGKAAVIPNFYIQGFDATTTVASSCMVDKNPVLAPNPAKMSWYSLTVTAAPSPVASDTCTVTATRTSDHQTATAGVTMQYTAGPAITPVNFPGTLKLPLKLYNQEYVAVVDPGAADPVFPILTISQPKAYALTCTDDHGAQLTVNKIASSGNDHYTLTIGYAKVAEEGSTDICTVTATGADGTVSAFAVTVVHTATPFQQSLHNPQPSPIKTSALSVTTAYVVTPFDADTQVGIRCDLDKDAKISGAGGTYTATIAAPPTTSPHRDHCMVTAAHNGIQSAIVPLAVESIPASILPLNFQQGDLFYGRLGAFVQSPPLDKNDYYAFVDSAGKDFPAYTIEDQGGIQSVQVTCTDRNSIGFDAANSRMALYIGVEEPHVELYVMIVRYKHAPPTKSFGDDCTIQVTNLSGQVTKGTYSVHWGS